MSSVKTTRLLLLLAVLALLTGLLAGCGDWKARLEDEAPDPDAEETDAPVPEITDEPTPMPPAPVGERVDLVFYVLGDAPPDQAAVEEAINAKLLEKLNATITFEFSTWIDFRVKYHDAMSSGQIDMAYTAYWMNYSDQVREGMFLPLDGLLGQYAPALKARCGDSVLNQCRVDGQVYCVPGLWPEYTPAGILYREDLRRKYNLPVPDSLGNMEAYFKGIQDNAPGQVILRATTEEAYGFNIAFDAAAVFDLKYPRTAPGGMPYGLDSNYDAPNQLYDYWRSQDFIDDCKLMKRWAGMGFWSRSALSDTRDENDFFGGQCVARVVSQTPNRYITVVNTLAGTYPDWYYNPYEPHPGWQAGFYAYGETTGVLYPTHATQNGTAILRSCKNPERAIQALAYIMTDEEMNRLVQAGIEGMHYDLDNGFYDDESPQPADPKPFDYEALNTWNLRVSEFRIPRAADIPILELFAKYEKIGSRTKFPNVNIWDGFTEDYTAYADERAAVREVMEQYLAPLQAGFVDDVETAVAEFLRRADAAGLQKCRDGFRTQWAVYCNAYGYD